PICFAPSEPSSRRSHGCAPFTASANGRRNISLSAHSARPMHFRPPTSASSAERSKWTAQHSLRRAYSRDRSHGGRGAPMRRSICGPRAQKMPTQGVSMPDVLELFLDRIDTPIGELLLVADGTGTLRAIDWADYEDRMLRLL